MKNYILKSSLLLLGLLLLNSSCKKDETNAGEDVEIKGEQYFYENVAIFDVRNRSISEQEYVKEIHIIDFGNTREKSTSFEYDNKSYNDDGTGDDLNAGDGIFTSTYRLDHRSAVPFDPSTRTKSVTDQILVMEGFKHHDALERHQRDFSLPKPTPSAIVELSCKIQGGKSGCLAEKWGWCSECCFSVDDCEITIGI